MFNLSLKFSNSKDPEPGRCKRTDGKKWRCSRDVAPNQKYCERHMHRGRPRSRKPVELHSPFTTPNNNKKPRSALPPTPKPTSHSPISSSPRLLESTMQPPNGLVFFIFFLALQIMGFDFRLLISRFWVGKTASLQKDKEEGHMQLWLCRSLVCGSFVHVFTNYGFCFLA